MTQFLVGMVILFLPVLGVLLIAHLNAPIGYEDERGFHYGEPDYDES